MIFCVYLSRKLGESVEELYARVKKTDTAVRNANR